MPSFKRFYMEKRKKTIQSRKNGAKLLQLAMISCSYNFIKLSMCSYNFNVAVRISINPETDAMKIAFVFAIYSHRI